MVILGNVEERAGGEEKKAKGDDGEDVYASLRGWGVEIHGG